MKLTFPKVRYGALAALALTLTACGGGGGSANGNDEGDAGADATSTSPGDAADDAAQATDATLDSPPPADANGDGAAPRDASDDALSSVDASDASAPDAVADAADGSLDAADGSLETSDASPDAADGSPDATDGASLDAAIDAAPDCDGGFLDPTFGTCGLFSTSRLATLLGTNAVSVLISRTVVQDTGEIVLAGDYATFESVGYVTQDQPFVTRVLADGSGIDPSFASGGVVSLPLYAGGPYLGVGLVSQSDGELLVSAACPTIVPGKTLPDVCVTRLGADGAVDSTYGAGGVAHVSFSSTDSGGGGLVSLDAQGRAFVVGWTQTSTTDTDYLVRLTTAGALDPTFNGGAPVVTVQASINDGAGVEGIAALPSGGILVSGGPELGSPNFHLAVLTSAGAPDDTIDPDAGASANVVPFPAAFEPGVLVTGPDGAVYAFGGTFAAPNPSLPTMVKVTASGGVDDTFGQGGEVLFSAAANGMFWGATIEGSSFYVSTSENISKFGLDGSLTTSWGSGGSVPVNWGPGSFIWSSWVMAAGPGGLVLTGSDGQTVYLARVLL